VGIKEKFDEIKHIGGLVVRDNWDFALAAGIAELPVLAKGGYVQLPSSLEELIPWTGLGLMWHSLLKKDSQINFMRKSRNAFIIFYGALAGNFDANSPLADGNAILALESAGMSIGFQYLFVRERWRGGAYK